MAETAAATEVRESPFKRAKKLLKAIEKLSDRDDRIAKLAQHINAEDERHDALKAHMATEQQRLKYILQISAASFFQTRHELANIMIKRPEDRSGFVCQCGGKIENPAHPKGHTARCVLSRTTPWDPDIQRGPPKERGTGARRKKSNEPG